MRLSLSKKEVAEIHLMLTTLPIPPIPLTVDFNTDKLEDGELKAAFEMATAPVVQDSKLSDGIVNAHSVFAAMSFFVKWSTSPSSIDVSTRQEDIQRKKDASLLGIIASVLDYNTNNVVSPSITPDKDILQIFVTASQAWINTYLPDGISVSVNAAPKNEVIGFEHDMHVAMAHYCYAQGVLYNSKDSRLQCKVHDSLYGDYLQLVKEAADEIHNEDNSPGTQEKLHEHIEIAKMYTQFSYHKMLLLCFDRLLKDCLYGHTMETPGNNVEQNARDLLKVSVDNYEMMMAKYKHAATSEKTSVAVGNTSCSTVVSNSIPASPDASDTPICPNTTPKNATIVQHAPFTQTTIKKQGCVTDMGSYKSAIGMFILGIINFMQNSDPYALNNMCASLRHLSELIKSENLMARQACALINIRELVTLVRLQLQETNCHRDMEEEIQSILLELEHNNDTQQKNEARDVSDVETLIQEDAGAELVKIAEFAKAVEVITGTEVAELIEIVATDDPENAQVADVAEMIQVGCDDSVTQITDVTEMIQVFAVGKVTEVADSANVTATP